MAESIGYPVLVRPSYVLGGRAMEIVYEKEKLKDYLVTAFQNSVEHPILIDKFLDDATEVDVDAIADGERVVIGGIMEHIEMAGVHSGRQRVLDPPADACLRRCRPRSAGRPWPWPPPSRSAG